MKWLRNIRISAKLILGFLVMALIAGAVGTVGILNIGAMHRNDTDLYGIHTQGIGYTSYAANYFQKTRFNALKMTVTEGGTQERCLEKVNEYLAETEVYLNLFEETIDDAETQGMYDAICNSWAMYTTLVESATRLVVNGDPGQAQNLLLSFASETAADLQEQFDALSAYNIGQAKDTSDRNARAAREATFIMTAIVAAAVILAVLMGLWISRMISRPIKKIARGAVSLANGETDIDDIGYASRDEVGQVTQSFQQVVLAIKALVADTGDLVQYAMAGDLSVRADAGRHQGDYRKIIEGVNRTLDATIAPVQESAQVLAEMAKGNLSVAVAGDYLGDHAIIKDALNDTIGRLNEYITDISAVLGEVARGNLAVGIQSDYMGDFVALKDSINNIVDSLHEIVREINASADQVAIGTQHLAEGSQEISQGATEQGDAIEELTSSINRIAEQARVNAASANEASGLTDDAKNSAKQGNEQMSAMQQAMTDINESSKNISKIIKVIDDIAFQTNILALNAAVEAARAGAQGKGFAVVAEEVRNLAVRSADAAKETTRLIEGSIHKTEAGTRLADTTAEALDHILDSVEKAARLVGEIALSSDQQTAAISQVNSGIKQMSQIVQTNSATSEEAAAAAEELSSQAEILKDMVEQFRLKSTDTDTGDIEDHIEQSAEGPGHGESATETGDEEG